MSGRGGFRGGYGRGGRGGGRGGGGFELRGSFNRTGTVGSSNELEQLLVQINGSGYGTYRDLKQVYKWEGDLPMELHVDQIQGDPYAPPSRFRVRLPVSATSIPDDAHKTRTRNVALADYLNRRLVSLAQDWRMDVADSSGMYHGPKGGDLQLYAPQQHVLQRSSVEILQSPNGEAIIEIRFTVTLPARGRTIEGHKAMNLLCKTLPKLVRTGCYWEYQNSEEVFRHVTSVETQEQLRNYLATHNLVSFIGNGSILPRASGADPRPLKEGAVSFKSPPSLEVTITLPGSDGASPISVTGMGIPKGVTVITGGGFHGKSTLLEAIQFGIYNVIPGDGRELVVTDPNAFKVRAEDGRSITCTDISPFISGLPGQVSTDSFSTPDASGSTSMASNIQEALEIGATTLLIDEDTSATNFMVRDVKMHELVSAEPITPLVSKVNALFTEKGVSTIIVIGGLGDYLETSTTVIGLQDYHTHDWTERAHAIAAKYPNATVKSEVYGSVPDRSVLIPKLGDKAPSSKGIDRIVFPQERSKVLKEEIPDIDISPLEQFVEHGQAKLCANALQMMSYESNPRSIREWVQNFEELMKNKGVNILGGSNPHGDIARARPLEMLAVVNRIRGLKVQKLRTSGFHTAASARYLHTAALCARKIGLRR